MATINEHTRKQIQTGVPSQEYKDGWDRIFGHKVDKTLDDVLEQGITPTHPYEPGE